MAAKPKDAKIAPAPSGAPRWTYAVGAIVGAAALLWGIVSYFIPSPRRPDARRGSAIVAIVAIASTHTRLRLRDRHSAEPL